jgi:putative DNA primase/helicase
VTSKNPGETPSLADAALQYARHGWYVFPCGTESKKPLIAGGHGFLDATRDESQIRAWWAQEPHANIAVATEASNLVVVDVDPRNGGDATFEGLREELGAGVFDTVIALTPSGGQHYIYAAQGAPVKSRANSLGAGVDLKAAGGYIMVAPSVFSGRRYEWENDAGFFDRDHPMAFPEALREKIAPIQDKPTAAAAPTLTEGQRHKALVSIAGSLRHRGLQPDEILPALVAVNKNRCDPPKNPRELEQIANSIGRYKTGATVDDNPFPLHTELEAAAYFAEQHGGDLRYCERAGGWFCWDGQRWLKGQDSEVMRRAASTVRAIADSAANLGDLDERRRRLQFAITMQKRRGIENMLALARHHADVAIANPDAFDADPMALNTVNGTIDLRTGILRPHAKANLITKIAEVNYDPLARAPRWLRFLDEVFGGNSDTIGFVRRAVGYSLTGNAKEQCFFILHGAGSNGKSIFLASLKRLTGDYGQNSDISAFVGRKPGSASNDLARLHGARFVSAAESSEGAPLAEGVVKTLTGSDAVSARYLFREFFDFVPVFKLWLATNHRPIIKGGDHAIWRRIRLIPFDERFEGDRCDPDLGAKLECEIPGILAWAVQGCLEWQRDGLGSATSVTAATASYRSEMDVFGDFIEERCTIDPIASAGASELFSAYRAWAEASGEKPLTQRWFGTKLGERGFQSARQTGGRKRWRGLRVNDNVNQVNDNGAVLPTSSHARAGEKYAKTPAQGSLGSLGSLPSEPLREPAEDEIMKYIETTASSWGAA